MALPHDLVPSEDEVKYPGVEKCPVVLLLDTSGSMWGEAIEELQKGLEVLLDSLLADPKARRSVELAIITFGEDVNLLYNFVPPEDVKLREFLPKGTTPMGRAIKMALDLIDERKIYLKTHGIQYYRPWLVLFTDGEPTDMEPGSALWEEVRERLMDAENRKKLISWAFGTSEANFDKLKALFPEGRVFKISDYSTGFESMFRWLSSSLRMVSSATPGEKVKVENPANYDGIDVDI
jgi:uncharacterized protein YegL